MKTRLTTRQQARLNQLRRNGENPCVVEQTRQYYLTGVVGEVLAAWLGRVKQ